MTGDQLAEVARGLREDVGELTSVVGTLAARIDITETNAERAEATAKRSSRVVIGLVVCLVLNLVTTVYLAWDKRQTDAYASCQAHYNEVNNIRTKALTEVAQDERDAQGAILARLGELVKGIASNATPAERANAFAELNRAYDVWFKVTEESAQRRQAFPVPPPPSQTCG